MPDSKGQWQGHGFLGQVMNGVPLRPFRSKTENILRNDADFMNACYDV
ncbi:hypothetical protein [Leptolyngbya sp. KIOST-1]|nr:hypothetical protein [Leptolyngbya sp. KIOST-1]